MHVSLARHEQALEMKILWVSPNFLHPTNKGGQIRTLEILRRLSRRHEIHYAAFEDPNQPEGYRRSVEYCLQAYPFRLHLPVKDSPAFFGQLAAGLFSSTPVAVGRFYAPKMARFLRSVLWEGGFDRVVCDFLAPAVNFPSLSGVVLFQHNVESMIWRRRVKQAPTPIHRYYLRRQAERMFAYERRACLEASAVIAVSEPDAQLIRAWFGVSGPVFDIPTGVDIDYFSPPAFANRQADLVFVGSMDWLPNIDGVNYFVREVLPLIRRRRPGCSLIIVGRSPSPAIQPLAQRSPGVTVTGTVPDVRPYLWGSTVSLVPLRIGGGTRLKIYESMAAKVPVVSTSIGAEGLPVEDPKHIRIADTSEQFAQCCIDLLDNSDLRQRQTQSAWEFVASSFSWEHVTRRFEEALRQTPPFHHSRIGTRGSTVESAGCDEPSSCCSRVE